jgi:hypothetical protein
MIELLTWLQMQTQSQPLEFILSQNTPKHQWMLIGQTDSAHDKGPFPADFVVFIEKSAYDKMEQELRYCEGTK